MEFAVPIGVPLPIPSDPADTSQYVLPALVTDKAGKVHSVQLPVRFVAANSESPEQAASLYGERQTELNGQPVAYVVSSGGADAAESPKDRAFAR